MDVDQLLRHLKRRLLDRKWLGTGGRVFAKGSVRITAAPLAQQQLSTLMARGPACLIRAGSSQADPENRELTDLLQQQVIVTPYVSIPKDEYGEAGLIGANRQSATTSAGRGLHKIEGQVWQVIRELGPDQGVTVQVVGQSSALSLPVDGIGYVHFREQTFEALVGVFPEYQAPRVFAASEAGGTVTLTWVAPDSVTDLIEYVVRRTTGTQGVAEPTLGDSVAVAPATALTTTNAPGSGTYTYSIFAGYNDAGPNSVYWSPYEVVTVVVP